MIIMIKIQTKDGEKPPEMQPESVVSDGISGRCQKFNHASGGQEE